MDYKKCIGLDVEIKVLYTSHLIKGQLVAMYSNVLCVQGLTMWGILISDIKDFKIIQLGLFQGKGGNSVTPPERTMGNTSNRMTNKQVG